MEILETDLLAFVGTVILTGNRKGIGFIKVGEQHSKTICFAAGKAFARFQIGGQYEVPRAESPDTWLFGKAKFIRPHTDREQVLQWQAREEARKLDIRALAVEKKVAQNGPLSDQIDKLRNFSQALTHAERSAFAAYIIKRIL